MVNASTVEAATQLVENGSSNLNESIFSDFIRKDEGKGIIDWTRQQRSVKIKEKIDILFFVKWE